MTRITCKTPSTGRSVTLSLVDVTSNYTTFAEAPDFSVPDPSENFPNRDPVDDTRAIKPGEIFFITPIAAKNKTANTLWIEVKLVNESNNSIEFGRVKVPGFDTVFIPVQGRSLFKRDANGVLGDTLKIRAEANNSFDAWASAEEKLSSEHIGIINGI